MTNVFFHASRTFAGLPWHHQRRIRDDWFRVIETAEGLRTSDGLVDGTIPRTLTIFGIEDRPSEEYRAYHHMLFNFFLFSNEAKVKSVERRRTEKGAAHAAH